MLISFGRGECTVVPRVALVPGSGRKVCQLPGEWARQRHTFAHNRTETRFGLVGTDPITTIPVGEEGLELSSLWLATVISLVSAVVIFRTV